MNTLYYLVLTPYNTRVVWITNTMTARTVREFEVRWLDHKLRKALMES